MCGMETDLLKQEDLKIQLAGGSSLAVVCVL